MKILITGAKGQLGRELCAQLECGKSALGPVPERLAHATVIPVDIEDADLTDRKQTATLIRRHAPDTVINCAAFTNVDAAETQRDAAFAVNALAPRNLAMACDEVGAQLIHLSTDYVYGEKEPRRAADGARLPFAETDSPAPIGAYGATKLLGEAYVRGFCRRWFIVRTAWLYGLYGPNFVKTMLRLADERDELTVVNDQLGNPTNAEDLAHHLLLLAPTKQYGLYHCTGQGTCSWYDFAAEIFRLSGKNVKLKGCTSAEYPSPTRRPPYSALDHAMLRATVGDAMRPWQDALADFLTKLNAPA